MTRIGGLASRVVAALAPLVLVLAAAADAAPACPPPPGFDAGARLEVEEVVVLYRTVPAAIEVGQHFAIEALVCARPTAPVTALRVDARMPEHRHGMNYRAHVSARGEGLYRAEGLLFHMPGHWQLLFDVERGGRTERLEADVTLE